MLINDTNQNHCGALLDNLHGKQALRKLKAKDKKL